MKRLKNNRTFAFICLIIIICLSVVLGGVRSVKSLEKKAYKAYYNDFTLYGEADNDMKKMSRYASMLSAVCEACGCATEDFALLADAFDKAVGTPYVEKETYDALFHAANLSYNLLINSQEASEQQKISAKQYFYEIDSSMRRLAENSAYNSLAQKYNKAVSGFPISLILESK